MFLQSLVFLPVRVSFRLFLMGQAIFYRPLAFHLQWLARMEESYDDVRNWVPQLSKTNIMGNQPIVAQSICRNEARHTGSDFPGLDAAQVSQCGAHSRQQE